MNAQHPDKWVWRCMRSLHSLEKMAPGDGMDFRKAARGAAERGIEQGWLLGPIHAVKLSAAGRRYVDEADENRAAILAEAQK